MKVLVVQYLVTLYEATRILRLFKQKKHASHGYFFELDDLVVPMKDAVKLPEIKLKAYVGKKRLDAFYWNEDAYVLLVYKDATSQVNIQ
jgi:hypothetical protein